MSSVQGTEWHTHHVLFQHSGCLDNDSIDPTQGSDQIRPIPYAAMHASTKALTERLLLVALWCLAVAAAEV
jgi:hypothetical protein